MKESVWTIYTNSYTYEFGEYKQGRRINWWNDYYTDNIFSPVITKNTYYEKEVVVKEEQIDFSEDSDKIHQYLMGDWIIRSFNEDQQKMHYQTGLIHLMRVTETIKIRPTSQYVKFLENNELETNSAYFEGGNSMKTWKMDQEKKMLVNGKTVVVEYVSDKEMILKVK